MKIKVYLTKKNGKVQRCQKVTLRRFRSIYTEAQTKLAYVYVSYGKGKDVFNREVEFTNEGIYTNRQEAVQAFKAFIDG